MKNIKRPKPFCVSVTGIDGSGKDTAAVSATKTYAKESGKLSALLSKEGSAIYNGLGEAQQIAVTTDTLTIKMQEYAAKRDSALGIAAANGLHSLYQKRVSERILPYEFPDLDVITTVRDCVVDPIVHLGQCATRLANNVNPKTTLKIIKRLSNYQTGLIIHLTVDPEIAMTRINERLSDSRRIHPHENPDGLKAIAEGYKNIFVDLREVSPKTTVIQINTNDKSKKEVADVALKAIISSKTDQIPPGDRVLL